MQRNAMQRDAMQLLDCNAQPMLMQVCHENASDMTATQAK